MSSTLNTVVGYAWLAAGPILFIVYAWAAHRCELDDLLEPAALHDLQRHATQAGMHVLAAAIGDAAAQQRTPESTRTRRRRFAVRYGTFALVVLWAIGTMDRLILR